MTNTRPVPSIVSPIVDLLTGKLTGPWALFFQQFVQKAPTIIDISALSPYTPNQLGTIITNAGATTVILTRGSVGIGLGNGLFIIPISIGDTVSWGGAATVFFLGA